MQDFYYDGDLAKKLKRGRLQAAKAKKYFAHLVRIAHVLVGD